MAHHPSSALRTFLLAERRPDYGLLAGFGILAVILAADVITGVSLAASYASAVFVSALVTSPHRSAVLAVTCVALSGLSGIWHDNVGTQAWALQVCLATFLTTLAVVAAELTYRRETKLRTMTVIAETAQRAVLRATPNRLAHVALATRYESATVAAAVGGDLYEAISTPYGVRAIIGDVRGKGIEAVETAATVLGAFRQSAPTEPHLDALTRTIDNVVSRVIGDEDFVTCLIVELTDDTIRVANAGHHPPLILTPATSPATNPHIAEVDTGEPTPPLGIFADPHVTEHPFPPGARLLLYTDGLVEARNAGGDFFDLHGTAPRLAHGTCADALDTLLAAVADHAAKHRGDDMALMMLHNATGTPDGATDASRIAAALS